MSYLERLKRKIPANALECEATKGTKVPYVPFVAPMPDPSRQIAGANDSATIDTDTVPDPAAEVRRRGVIAMLMQGPTVRYAALVDNPDTDPVLVIVGIRDVATFEIEIPAAKFDAFALLELIERHGATVH